MSQQFVFSLIADNFGTGWAWGILACCIALPLAVAAYFWKRGRAAK
jgi:ABC-type multidrug transport system permease subunit